MKQLNYLYLIILIVFICCTTKQDNRTFPDSKDISTFKKTEFLPTLEHNISPDKNAIYCATLLYAWDKIRDEIDAPLKIDKLLNDLTLLNNSKSYIDVLKRNEYEVSANITGNQIETTAEFKKSLPFDTELSNVKDRLNFNGEKVEAFGDKGQSDMINILYYNNDSDFVIKLTPKDKEHEIILCKANLGLKSMSDIYNEVHKKILMGELVTQNGYHNLLYIIRDMDEVIIPKIQFNIESHYTKLEGNQFQSNLLKYQIKIAEQKTAFLLDEKGADISSYDRMCVIELSNKKEELKPKKLIFDKPFCLFLKRKESKYPYMGLWIANTELMIKE